MTNDLTIPLPVLASDYEQTIEMLEKQNAKLREAIIKTFDALHDPMVGIPYRVCMPAYDILSEVIASEYRNDK